MSYPEVLGELGSRALMLGNVAVARACLEHGVGFASGYPGTPSSEIIEALAYASSRLGYPHVEWSVNEKVAFEAAYGSAMAGVPSVVTMKHVGLNVAADPLFSSAYTGVEASFLIVSADDPGMWSSQNEQDNRWYGVHAYIPVFEPAGAQEAREDTLEALRFSESVKHPVILRLTTRVSHTRAPVTLGALAKPRLSGDFIKNVSRWNIVPMHARRLREELLSKWEKMGETLSENPVNTVEGPEDSKVLVVGVGLGYRYARESLHKLGALGGVRLLKIVTSIPLPRKLLVRESEGRSIIVVVEEGDPVLETLLKSTLYEEGVNVKVYGKASGHLKWSGELKADSVTLALASILGLNYRPEAPIKLSITPPPRPPVLCPGCPYRSVFYALRRAVKMLKVEAIYSGDIGCYSLGLNPPFNVQDTLIEMGGSIGLANGLAHVVKDKVVVATIGDSTFFHAGLPGVVNSIYNRAPMVILVLDNGTTAMTGHQPHPGSGRDALGREARRLTIEDVVRGLGVSRVSVADSFDTREVEAKISEAIRDVMYRGETHVVIARGACILDAMRMASSLKVKRPIYVVESDKCRACGICYRAFNCPAITPGEDGRVAINASLCTGCGVCEQVCPFKAIRVLEPGDPKWSKILGMEL
ncbi:MAG: indolepyruvate ferredoxin oxidoreductase subunit alpha [Thermoprotei archaeon]|nr:indolepyruvate ferredoxin oxidoreductase subunit alpha [Thermoprotei archaeon]